MPYIMTQKASEKLPLPVRDMAQDPAELAFFRQWSLEEGARISPAMRPSGPGMTLDKQRYVLVEPGVSTDLRQAIIAAQEAGFGRDIQIENCTWEDVEVCKWAAEDAMMKAKGDYLSKGVGMHPRRVLRHGATIAQIGRPLLDFIPDELGLKVLRAGLAMLFTVLEKRETNREEIFDAFQDIEGIFMRAQQRLKDFNHEITIKAEVASLVKILFEQLPNLLDLLRHEHKHTGLHRIPHVCRPEQESQKIKDIVKKVNNAYQSLNEVIQEVANKTTMDTNRAVHQAARETSVIRQTVSNLGVDVCQRLDRMDDRMDDYAKFVAATYTEMARKFSEIIASIQEPVLRSEIRTGVYLGGLEMQYERDAQMLPAAQSRSPSPLPRPKRGTVVQLLKLLPPPLHTAKDLQRVLSSARSMAPLELAHVRWLLACPRFQAWLRSAHSDLLLADGGANWYSPSSMTSATITPLSVFTATFALAIRQLHGSSKNSRAVLLTYFCGEHFFSPSYYGIWDSDNSDLEDDDDEDKDEDSDEAEDESENQEQESEKDDKRLLVGPAGIVKSLLSQILVSLSGDDFPDWPGGGNRTHRALAPLPDPELVSSSIAEDNVGSIMQAISILLSFPSSITTTVYILIDNISLLSGRSGRGEEAWDKQLDELIDGLERLVNNNNAPGFAADHNKHIKPDAAAQGQVMVKVLITSATTCPDFARRMDGERRRVSLDAGYAHPGTMGETAFLGDVEALFSS